MGIGQALAMGLPVIASDIPAHREFDIFTSDFPMEIFQQLASITHPMVDQKMRYSRVSKIEDWNIQAGELLRHVDQVIDKRAWCG